MSVRDELTAIEVRSVTFMEDKVYKCINDPLISKVLVFFQLPPVSFKFVKVEYYNLLHLLIKQRKDKIYKEHYKGMTYDKLEVDLRLRLS
jgi:hypothetical protein